MAIVENPIIGTAKNAFSTVIYQHYFNKNIIRSKPLIYHDANTPAQQNIRNYMKNLTSAGRNFTELLKYNLVNIYDNVNYWNAFNKLNFNSSFIDEFGNKKISFDLLKFSTGTLNSINLDSIENVGNNTLRFIFSDISNLRASYTSYLLQILIYDEISNNYTYTSFLDAKNNLIFDFSIQNLNNYTNKRIYFYFHSKDFGFKDLRKFSNTNYYLFI